MKSTYWLDEAKKASGIESDNQLAALLGMTRAAISNHRQGISKTLKDEHAYRIEEVLELPHGKIVLDQHAEGASDPDISAMWRKLAATAAAILVLTFCGLSFAPKALAEHKNGATSELSVIYIIRSGGRCG